MGKQYTIKPHMLCKSLPGVVKVSVVDLGAAIDSAYFPPNLT